MSLPARVAFFIGPLLVTLAGCGSRLEEEQQAPSLHQLTADAALADDYFVEDLPCQAEAGARSLGEVRIASFLGGSIKVADVDGRTMGSESSLHGPGIAATYFDFQQRAECQTKGDPASCGAETVISAAKPLKICRSESSFNRISVEAVALSGVTHIGAAFNFYQGVPGRKELQPAQLLVLPIVEKTYASSATRDVATDNLAYVPEFQKAPAFVIYPKGQGSKWKDVNFWEIPWGLAHEFGHHVFRTHSGINTTGDSLGENEPLVEAAVGHGQGSQGLALTAVRVVGDKQILGSVNEGFADLFAYYAYGAKPGLTNGLLCFEKNRDVGSDVFGNGDRKILSKKALQVFFSSSVASTDDCESPNFQDSHLIGAAIANGIDRFFSAGLGASVGEDAARKKTAMLFKWAERIGQLKRMTAEGKLTFAALLKEAIFTVNPDGRLSAAACSALKEAFPEYMATWQKSGVSC